MAWDFIFPSSQEDEELVREVVDTRDPIMMDAILVDSLRLVILAAWVPWPHT